MFLALDKLVETHIFGSAGGAGISTHIRGKLNLLLWYARWQCHEHLMTSCIGGVVLNVCIRETEMVVIMTGASQDKGMDSIGTASGVSQDRSFSNSVSQDTGMGGGIECLSVTGQELQQQCFTGH